MLFALLHPLFWCVLSFSKLLSLAVFTYKVWTMLGESVLDIARSGAFTHEAHSRRLSVSGSFSCGRNGLKAAYEKRAALWKKNFLRFDKSLILFGIKSIKFFFCEYIGIMEGTDRTWIPRKKKMFLLSWNFYSDSTTSGIHRKWDWSELSHGRDKLATGLCADSKPDVQMKTEHAGMATVHMLGLWMSISLSSCH